MVEAKAKAGLQLPSYIWEIDSRCLCENRLAQTTNANVLIQGFNKSTEKPKEKASSASCSKQPELSKKAWKEKKKR